MATRYLTKEHIVRIHHELIERYGGLQGLRDEALLESAIGRYQSGYYADQIEEASALMESLAQNHPFFDGNKRIAVNAGITSLILNGYSIQASDAELFDFVVQLFETNSFSFGKLEPWLREHISQRDSSDADISDEPGQALSYCASALTGLMNAQKEAADSLALRTDEWVAMEAHLVKAVRTITPATQNQLRLPIHRATGVLRRAAQDLAKYATSGKTAGDQFIEGWATAMAWAEDQIPTVEQSQSLEQLAKLLLAMTSAISQTRAKFALISDLLAPLLKLDTLLEEPVPSHLSGLVTPNRQFVDGVGELKRALNAATTFHQHLDESLSMAQHSCSQLIAKVHIRVNELTES
jgi:death-on-curing protein